MKTIKSFLTILVLLLSIASITFASIGKDTTAVGTICSMNTVEQNSVIPVAKFLFEEEVDGLYWGSQILGLVSLSTAISDGWITVFKDFIQNKVIGTGTEFLVESPHFFGKNEKPEYVLICFKYDKNQNNGSISNEDILFLFEYKNGVKIEVGIPYNVTYNYNYLPSEVDYPAPKFAKIVEATALDVSNSNFTYKSVHQAGYEMRPMVPVFSEKFTFYTIGVTSGYIDHFDKKYLIMQQFKETEFFFSETMDMNYVAVDVTDRSSLPEIGSVIKVGGTTKRLKHLITQEARTLSPSKNIKALIPDFLDVLNGNQVSNPTFNSTLFYIYGGMDYELVGIQWPGTTQKPDFTISFPMFLWISPSGIINIGNTYTIKADIQNLGNVSGDATVDFYYYSIDPDHLIGSTEVLELNPLEVRLIPVEWNTTGVEIIPQKSLTIIAVIRNVSPLEENIANNFTYLEHHFSNPDHGSQVTAYCPVTLEITTKDNKLVSIETNEIDGALYEIFDYNNDGEIDHRIYLPRVLSQSEIEIKVIPTEEADEDDIVTIEVFDDNNIIVIADSVVVNDIQDTTYTFDVTDVKLSNNFPTEYSLLQNHPNPFNPSTSIQYHIKERGNVKLKVYDALGKEVAILVNGVKTAGIYQVEFNASQLSSGIYYYQIITGKFVETKKMMLLK